jgi:transcriptional regulator with XRE-family HTH domain
MSKGTELGLRVREARIEAGLSMSALAKRAGMSLAYVTLLEAGKIPAPTVDRLSRVAIALHRPLGSILEEAEYSIAQRKEQHTGLVDELTGLAPNADAEIVRTFTDGLLHLSREGQLQVAQLIMQLRDRQKDGQA